MQVIVENVTKKYQVGEEEITVLDAVNFRIEAGDFLVVTGPSGAGKTTLLNLLGTLDEPSAGSILYDGWRRAPCIPTRWRIFAAITSVLSSSSTT
jgi:putative ABC transport system ATP-binding protein